jgi:hypothetical protein
MDEKELNDLVLKANGLGIKFAVFYEPDLNNELTAIALEPGKHSGKLCNGMKLLG